MGIKEKLVERLANKHNLDPRVVRLAVDYPVKFSKAKMSNEEDFRPVRIRYFAVFLPKKAGNEWKKSSETSYERINDSEYKDTTKS